MNQKHVWKFSRVAGFDQVVLGSGADLAALDQLDQKLWVALACPAADLEFDSKTLAMLDTDKDGRIRAPDIIAAAKWACGHLKNPDDLLKGSPELLLSSINEAAPDGQQLREAARQVLSSLGKERAHAITFEDLNQAQTGFAQRPLNGDGIIPSSSALEPETKQLVEDIIACQGPEADLSGKPGVSQAKLDEFFANAGAYLDWRQKSELDPAILPLGGATPSAAAALDKLKTKVDDYFTRTRMAAFDSRAETALNRDEQDYFALAGGELTPASAEIASFPIAHVGAGTPLPLREAINPAWADLVTEFRTKVVEPFLGPKAVLSETEWLALQERFAAYHDWLASKSGASVEKLGIERLRAVLQGNGRENLSKLITADLAFQARVREVAVLDQLLHFHRDLYRLLNNFVCFRDFYTPGGRAIFQAGTLYLDQRSCDLCLPVDNPASHAVLASLSGAYLAYCDCVRKSAGEKMQIVAAFTDGDSDNLVVGRNGLFYDRKGRDWDATIIRIQDNPISIRQAFWAPYKKAARAIQEQFAKRAAAADDLAVTTLAQVATHPRQPSPTPSAARPAPRKLDPGMIAALSVGIAGVGGMIGGIVTGFLALKWMMPLGVLAFICAISGPSMILAWLKLRRRNIGPILDANGWAVNARARINVPFGATLTRRATLPPGARREVIDPFAEKIPRWWVWWLIVLLLLLGVVWWQGVLDSLLPLPIRSTSVLGANAPSYRLKTP